MDRIGTVPERVSTDRRAAGSSARPGGCGCRALLAGVSIAALLAALALPEPAEARWTVQRAGSVRLPSGVGKPPTLTGAQSARVQRSLRNFDRTGLALRTQLIGQARARALAAATNPAVPDGLVEGGLKPHPTTGWINADDPTETRDGDDVEVTIRQTAAKAILTWETFNVGARTHLDFDQQGNRNWSVLNRVEDPRQAPSQILGRITADGTVLVINRNGILFTGTSQVNVGGLVASSLDVGLPTHKTLADRDRYFQDNSDGTLSFSFNLKRNADGTLAGSEVNGREVFPEFIPEADPLEGDVVVAAGAVIGTEALSSTNQFLGRVVLAAPRVSNAGTIQTPDGQAILVGARNFTLVANDEATLNALRTRFGSQSPEGLRLSVRDDLRGAQVFSGSDDFFTAGSGITGTLETQAPGYDPNVAIGVALDVRNVPRPGGGSFDAPLVDAPLVDPEDPSKGRGFSVTNTGLVTAQRGNITIQSQRIALTSRADESFDGGVQTGLFHVTTATNANGSIFATASVLPFIEAATPTTEQADPGNILIDRNAVVAMMPDLVQSRDATTFVAGDALLGDQPTLSSDSQSLSQFRRPVAEFTVTSRGSAAPEAPGGGSLGTLEIGAGALIMAPSAALSLGAPGRGGTTDPETDRFITLPTAGVRLGEGAEIDVSGLSNVLLPMSSNTVRIARVGNLQLADQVVQKNGFLFGKEIFIDRRLIGEREDGTTWYGTPLLDAKGDVDARGRTVSELLTAGGDLALTGVVEAAAGSVIDVSGGFIAYEGGVVGTTILRAAGGRDFVDIGSADPFARYSGIGGSFVRPHGRWNRTEVFPTLVGGRSSRFEAGYVEGADGGSLTVEGAALLDDATLRGEVVTGPYQRAGSGRFASAAPRAARLDLTGLSGRPDVTIATPTDETPLPESTFVDQHWSTERLAETGFGDIRLGAKGGTTTVAEGANLVLPAGGSLTLTGQIIDVAGTIRAPSGDVTLDLAAFVPTSFINSPTRDAQPRTQLSLRSGGVIDVSGLWVNDAGATRDTLFGRDHVDGGSVTIRNGTWREGGGQTYFSDLVSIDLAEGSRIDLNSGGYVTPAGELATGSNGVAIGRGGDLAILLHRSPDSVTGTPDADFDYGDFVPENILIDPETAGLPTGDIRQLIDDRLAMSGTISAFGFQGGGTFTLRAPEIDVRADDGTVGGEQGRFIIPATFFEQQGFGAYTLVGLLRAGIDPGTVVRLSQRQFIPRPGAQVATRLADAADIGVRFGQQRAATNFSMAALGWMDYATFSRDNGFGGREPLLPSFYADNTLTIGSGAQILADPGADIRLAARGQLTLDGTISAPGGTVALRQVLAIADGTDGTEQPASFGNTSLYLGETAVIDVSGTFVPDPQQLLFRDGEVLKGGTVSLSGDQIIGVGGSEIRASGATGTIDLQRPIGGLPGVVRVGTLVGSDAGTITVEHAGRGPAAFDTTLIASGGTAANAGGTLSLTSTSGAITVVDDAVTVPDDAAPATRLTIPGLSLFTPTLLFSTARLTDSGIDALVLRAPGLAETGGRGSIAFSGDVSVSVARRIEIAASNIRWLREGDLDPALAPIGFNPFFLYPNTLQPGDTGRVRINAPYVRLTQLDPAGEGNPDTNPAAIGRVGGARLGPTLEIDAQAVDIAETVALLNWGTTRISAAGDVRFNPGQTTNGQPSMFSGLISGGDIEITAAQVYPATGTEALIQSIAGAPNSEGELVGDGSIVIRSTGNPAPIPLSAGGRLILSAPSITQGGVVRAPLGRVQLGVTDDNDIDLNNRFLFYRDAFGSIARLLPTTQVSVEAGSITSVSAGGALIPYGETRQQKDWLYNGGAVTAAPAKGISIVGDEAELADGALLDLSGGGDVYASEFIAGLGGSRNILVTSLNGDPDAPVYALVPTMRSGLAPVDPTMQGNTPDTPGLTLTLLADIPGGPRAGTYVLLPGSYATLPGAWRVQQANSSVGDLLPGRVYGQKDGSVTVAGHTGYLGTGIGNSGRPEAWTLMSGNVWRQYSQVESTSGNAFFRTLATAAGRTASQLPTDAGRLSLETTTRLAFDAQTLFTTPAGGRGGQVDIAAPQILVAADGTAVPDGFLLVTPETVRNLNATSLVLGATRSSEQAGDRLNVKSSEIVVQTTETDPLVNPELILVATETVTAGAGSVIRSEGDVASGGVDLLIGREEVPDPLFPFNPPLVTAQSGDAALLRVSGGDLVQVVRANVPDAATSRVVLGDGSRIEGGRALTLDAPGDVSIAPDATLIAQAIDLASTTINVLNVDPATPPAGANLNRATLDGIIAGARQLTLRASRDIVFYGAGELRAADGAPRLESLTLGAPTLAGNGIAGGDVLLDATTVTLANDAAAAVGDPALAAGRLVIAADRVVMGAGDTRVSGFDAVSITATQAIAFGDGKTTGTLRLPGDVVLDAPKLVATTGSTQTLSASGTLRAVNGAGTLAEAGEDIGGKLVLEGSAVAIDTSIEALAGILEVRAATGDVTLEDGARLVATGFTQRFLDHSVMLSGGRILLWAEAGDVTTAAGSLVDVSAVAGGNAGLLKVQLGGAGGTFAATGTVRGSADTNRTGGAFILDSAGAVALDGLAALVDTGGFTDRFAVRSGVGDLTLSTSVRAHEVALVADGGAVDIAGDTDVNASGAAGGRIDLYGRDGVALASGATLLARASDATERGGQVNIGTGDGGNLLLAGGSTIDVSGGSPYGSGGGVIHLRTPIGRALAAVLDADFVRSPVTNDPAVLTPVIFEPYTRVVRGGGDVTLTGAAFTAILNDFAPAVAPIAAKYADVLVQPGLEIVNPDGAITLTNLQIDLGGRRYGATEQPGWLTLRAREGIELAGTLSDGFTGATAAGELRTVSFADAAAGRLPAGTASWSYRFAAGSRTDSADPLAVVADTSAGDFRFGDGRYDPEKQFVPNPADPNDALPTQPLGRNDILRTGTGSIEIAAAGNVELLNPISVIYTAGVGVDWTTIPGFVDVHPSVTDASLRNAIRLYDFQLDVAQFAGGSRPGVDPRLVGAVATVPALPTKGGDLRIYAGGDILGQQNVTDVTGRVTRESDIFFGASGPAIYIGQLFDTWLRRQGRSSDTADLSGPFGGLSGGTPARQSAQGVLTGMFQQGFATLGGGELAVEAGGTLRNASFSVVSSFVVAGGKTAGAPLTEYRFGGGNLTIDVGGDIASSIFYVGDGVGNIRSGGALTSDFNLPTFDDNSGTILAGDPLGNFVAFGDARINVEARGEISLGKVLSGSELSVGFGAEGFDEGGNPVISEFLGDSWSSYGLNNELRLLSTGGDVQLGGTAVPPTGGEGTFLSSYGAVFYRRDAINSFLPPTVRFIAPRGDIRLRHASGMVLAPAPNGSLDLLAQSSITYSFQLATRNEGFIAMLDLDPERLSNPRNPNGTLALVTGNQVVGYALDRETNGDLNRFTLHAGPTPLHFDDREPARIIALEGDIISGPGLSSDPVEGVSVGQGGGVFLNKQAVIFAGRDIVNLTYTGTNNQATDVTSIQAGRDITFVLETVLGVGGFVTRPAGSSFIIGGPGSFIVDAGRNLNLRPSEPTAAHGVQAVANRINPYHPAESADVSILFGTGPGKNIAGFISRYLDPTSPDAADYLADLVAFMNARLPAASPLARAAAEAPAASPEQPTPEEAAAAFAAFQLLTEREQLTFLQGVFMSELRSAATDPSAGRQRAETAIATLFPPSADPAIPGYTDNAQGNPVRVRTGDFSMLNAVVRTDYGSGITILGPGGDALIGGFTVNQNLPLNVQGVFTLRGGAIDAFVDGNFAVNNSRVLTAQGGDITIVSANGDIDAGRGSRTASFSAPIAAAYTPDVISFVDFGGRISGSGIGTLVTLPGAPPGNVFLVALRGAVDAGEAGIRSSGNLSIVAQVVRNAANIDVGGSSVGLPQASAAPSAAALSSSGSQSQTANDALEQLATAAGGNAARAQDIPSIISVEVLGFGS